MAIRIEHLNKHIGKQHVLKDVNLTIGDGEVIGLLGPNGAGKSTLMKIMVGVWDATSGEVQVPKSVGFLPEQNPLYEDMYVREYLRFFVELRTPKPMPLHPTPYTLHPTPYTLHQQVEDLINRVGLTAEANKKIGQLSKGYKQRVGLAQARRLRRSTARRAIYQLQGFSPICNGYPIHSYTARGQADV